jgi:hypothetical protein
MAFGVDVRVKNWFFDRAKVQALMDKKTLTALSKAGDRTRKAGRRLIGNPSKAKPRAPGKPPRARSNSDVVSLRNIQYGFQPGNQSVLVGPLRLSQGQTLSGVMARGTVPELHEFGGTAGIREKQITYFERGQRVQEWVRMGRRKARPGQAVRVRIARYQARPFMGPALAKVMPKFPQLWAGQAGATG